MTAVKPKPDKSPHLIRTDELQIELSNRVETLERSLQEELIKRTSVEFELYQIKNSLAWKILHNYRSLRDKLFAEGTLRLACYELVRDFCKVLLLKGQAVDSSNRRLPRLIAKAFWIVRSEGLMSLRRQLRNEVESKYEYSEWIEKYDTLTDADRAAISRHIDQLSYKPLISVVMPVHNTPEKWLRLAVESVCRQLYPKWELCIADDASVEPAV